MKKNDKICLEIEDLSVDGEGIGKTDGLTVFVPGAIPGDRITAGITKVKKTMAYARILQMIRPSADRIEPACPIAGKCGGCSIMQMRYEAQLAWKEKRVRDALIRIGGFDEMETDLALHPIAGMDNPYYYRNKSQFPVGTDGEGNPLMGFYARHSHRIVENDACRIADPMHEIVRKTVLQWIRDFRIPVYDETTGAGLVRHLLIRTGHATGEISVCLVAARKNLPHIGELIQDLEKIDGMTSIAVNVNSARSNVILGKDTFAFHGRMTIRDRIGKMEYAISPRSFYQVNPVQTEKLYAEAVRCAGLTGKEIVWDLYCGIGTISLAMASHAKQVCGVEVIPEATADAEENARRNGIDNVRFMTGRAEDILPKFVKNHPEDASAKPDVIVVDPPRKGCDSACLETMLSMHPERIVYISCNPSTLARDLNILCGKKEYRLASVLPVDMFPHSCHVETVVLMSKVK